MPEPVRQSAASPSRPLVGSLASVRRTIRRYQLAWACVAGLGFFTGALAIAAALERLTVLQEQTALTVLAGAAVLAMLVGLRELFRALFRTPSVVSLALGVEAAHPELLDSFVCAVELEASGRQDFGPLEEALLNRARAETTRLELPRIFRRSLRWGRLLLFSLLITATTGILGNSRVARKARFHLRDWLAGTSSGLRIDYPTAPIPEHTDARIEVTVSRWEPEAEILYEDADGNHRFPLNHAPDGSAYFTLYDLTGTTRFRIQTPSLRSPWQLVGAYVPPQFDAVSLRVRQPAYTGRKDLLFNDFKNCTAVDGSRIELEIRTDPRVHATVLSGSDQLPMQTVEPGTFRFARPLKEAFTFRVRLRTDQGFTALGAETIVRGEPDLPPVVEAVEPRRDTQVLKDETVYLEARASDDFGVRSVMLKYTISGRETHVPVLYKTDPKLPPEAEVTTGEKLDLAKLKVKDGDVIAYAFIAWDNRQPELQAARSRVFFITIRPDLEEAKKQESEGKGEQAKVDLSALIAELKRLIRLSWDQLDARGTEQDALRAELYRGLKDLSVETSKKMNEVLKAAGGKGASEIREAFEAVDHEILRAAGLVEKKLVEEAMGPEQRALAILVAIENELLKNAAKSKGKGKGKEKGKDDDKEKEKPPEQDGDKAAQQAQAMAKIREALERVRRLAERQDGQNRDLQRAPDDLDQPLAKALGDKQNDIRDGSASIRKELSEIPDAAQASRDLEAAEREMTKGNQALDRRNLPVARPHGARAHHMLLSATRSLEEAQRKQAAERINQLAQAAQQLANAESQAADASARMGEGEKPGDEQVKGARERQNTLKEMNDQLGQAIERTAGEFEESFPKASRALAEAARSARDAGTGRKMARATNALLYRRFDKASREQTEATNELRKLSSDLSAAGKNLPTMSREELLEAMRQLQKQAQGIQKTMQQGESEETRSQLRKQAQKGAQSLDALASAMQEDSLQQIADDMSMPQGGENAMAEGRRILGMYRAAMRVLEGHLIDAGVQRKLGLSRETANPPEKYRRLVEQYFKDLSREK